VAPARASAMRLSGAGGGQQHGVAGEELARGVPWQASVADG